MLQKLSILFIILIVKAIFSAGDTAITYLNKAKISQESKKSKKAKKIKEFSQNSVKFYGAVEVGITLTELVASAFASEVFVYPLASYMQAWKIPFAVSIVFAIILITIILSYVLLVFGSILPKRIARNHPEKTAYRLINILWLFSKINYPFEKIISASTNFLTRLFGIQNMDKQTLTEKEIKMIIAEGKDQGVVSDIEKEIAFNALKFNDILVKNIMIPKEKIDFIDIEQQADEILQNISMNPYTRLPVYQGKPDNVIGIFNIKDIAIEYAKSKKVKLDLQKFLRPVTFVDKEATISHVFRDMQLNNRAMVIVVDKDKKVVGLVTAEDILEKLVGKMFDEYDKE